MPPKSKSVYHRERISSSIPTGLVDLDYLGSSAAKKSRITTPFVNYGEPVGVASSVAQSVNNHHHQNTFVPIGSSSNVEIVEQLLEVLNAKNAVVKLFRIARDRIVDMDVPDFRIRLYDVIGSKQYERPTSDAVGAIVFETGDISRTDYDLIVEYKGGTLKRVNKLHALYMSLQFPLLFVYGQPGYHLGLTLRDVGSRSTRKKNKMTMNMFYSYQLHDRYSAFNLLGKCGRLFQQYIVTAYCSIELDRIDYVKNNQREIRNEYLSGLYDAINRGDHYGSDVGSRTILPASFTGGPRYMYSHYLDALAISRVYGNPILLYTIEFQKRGLPHCHSLLWVQTSARSLEPEEVDRFVSAELPNPKTNPEGFRIVSELMIHGPCGEFDKDAPCMENRKCTNRFPKPFNNNTYFDKDGFVHYQRRNTKIEVDKSICNLENGYIVPYNRYLCLRFLAHINVE
ncbi:uncharacterized protein [Rutidosis leptorrhynchoides]|uniref:uncharacterized protein n=1 Tax=Rutidosis leptorrhynchoides TaxID=125765 RepID=UPI003A9A2884